jgi:hypothetical protein
MNVVTVLRGSLLWLALLPAACASASTDDVESLGSDVQALTKGDLASVGESSTAGGVAKKNKDGEVITCVSNCDKDHGHSWW